MDGEGSNRACKCPADREQSFVNAITELTEGLKHMRDHQSYMNQREDMHRQSASRPALLLQFAPASHVCPATHPLPCPCATVCLTAHSVGEHKLERVLVDHRGDDCVGGVRDLANIVHSPVL